MLARSHFATDEEFYAALRDWFAGQVVAGMTFPHDYSSGSHNEAIAARAYAIADCMLAARAPQEGGGQ